MHEWLLHIKLHDYISCGFAGSHGQTKIIDPLPPCSLWLLNLPGWNIQ